MYSNRFLPSVVLTQFHPSYILSWFFFLLMCSTIFSSRLYVSRVFALLCFIVIRSMCYGYFPHPHPAYAFSLLLFSLCPALLCFAFAVFRAFCLSSFIFFYLVDELILPLVVASNTPALPVFFRVVVV
ncbi:hypothetical protein BXZ70DRAFT_649774 [Cristinia sonorae]|uniref:Uncharacterized protein n=1 Tax=Cristinia sonorae TaxID=1940300 RepID=A0A8K0XKN6_9AGAR|nr:hypothetical protein BXZ70DRAFT_649774 [Cristinia sonorae]